MSIQPFSISTLGMPRIGPRRELKFAQEAYWSGKSDVSELLSVSAKIRADNWTLQKQAGVSAIPSNDFSLYDQVLDTICMVGAVPPAYDWNGGEVTLDTYFAMARGNRETPAMEMTKWFDTNYHYIVPEFHAGQSFSKASNKPLDQYQEAKALGVETRPVLVGPVTFLALGKSMAPAFDRFSLLPALLPAYVETLMALRDAGAEWVQIDEPCLALDPDERLQSLLRHAYALFAQEVPGLNIMLTSYFGGLEENLSTALAMPVAGLHIDLARAPDQLDDVLAKMPEEMVLSLGVIDGRNIWRTDLEKVLDRVEPVVEQRGRNKVQIAPSCSLLHVPMDLELETELDRDLKSWLAFAVQKTTELSILGKALAQGRESVREELAASTAAAEMRRYSPKVHDSFVTDRVEAVTADMASRSSPFAQRREKQQAKLNLPTFPTTTIGSFPQTSEVRKARAAYNRGEMDDASYNSFLREKTEEAIRWQEDIGMDVLVHGEFERNDMVQYFGEQLSGYAFTKFAWVQSYGSRCVRPPIIFGDVSRPHPMTVEWAKYAQSLTGKPVKGMLTGPVTMLQWSFVRDDLPRSEVCKQIALAIRDEVQDLEAAGIGIIQIDEAALREGLPLKRSDWPAYLDWAVTSFRLTSSGVADETQIHTHMCYSEFNDIISAIGAMDADVISIETSRSKMELLDAFVDYRYPNEIGPGVYDIHSPRVPDEKEMVSLLNKAANRIPPQHLWVNPDCGLKTRGWEETRPAIEKMIRAAHQVRKQTGQAAE